MPYRLPRFFKALTLVVLCCFFAAEQISSRLFANAFICPLPVYRTLTPQLTLTIEIAKTQSASATIAIRTQTLDEVPTATASLRPWELSRTRTPPIFEARTATTTKQVRTASVQVPRTESMPISRSNTKEIFRTRTPSLPLPTTIATTIPTTIATTIAPSTVTETTAATTSAMETTAETTVPAATTATIETTSAFETTAETTVPAATTATIETTSAFETTAETTVPAATAATIETTSAIETTTAAPTNETHLETLSNTTLTALSSTATPLVSSTEVTSFFVNTTTTDAAVNVSTTQHVQTSETVNISSSEVLSTQTSFETTLSVNETTSSVPTNTTLLSNATTADPVATGNVTGNARLFFPAAEEGGDVNEGQDDHEHYPSTTGRRLLKASVHLSSVSSSSEAVALVRRGAFNAMAAGAPKTAIYNVSEYIDEGLVDISNNGAPSTIDECLFSGSSTVDAAGLPVIKGSNTTTAVFSSRGFPTPTPSGNRHILTVRRSRFVNSATLTIYGESSDPIPMLITIDGNTFDGYGVAGVGRTNGIIVIRGELPRNSVINITNNTINKGILNPNEMRYGASDCAFVKSMPNGGLDQLMFSFVALSELKLGNLGTLRIESNTIEMNHTAAASGWTRLLMAVLGVNGSLALESGEQLRIQRNPLIHLTIVVASKLGDVIPELECDTFDSPFLSAAVVMLSTNSTLAAGGTTSAGAFIVSQHPNVRLLYAVLPMGAGASCLPCWPDAMYSLSMLYVSSNATLSNTRAGTIEFSSNEVAASSLIVPADIDAAACDLWASRATTCLAPIRAHLNSQGRLAKHSGMAFAHFAAPFPAPPPTVVPCNATNATDPLDPCASGFITIQPNYVQPNQLSLSLGGSLKIVSNAFTASPSSAAHLWATNSIAFLVLDGSKVQVTSIVNISSNKITLTDEGYVGAGSHPYLQQAQQQNALAFCQPDGCNHHATNSPRVLAVIRNMGSSTLTLSGASGSFAFARNDVRVEGYYPYQSVALWSHRQLDRTGGRGNAAMSLSSWAQIAITDNTIVLRAGLDIVVPQPSFAALGGGFTPNAYVLKTHGDAVGLDFSTGAINARSTVSISSKAAITVRNNTLSIRSDTRNAAVWRQGSFGSKAANTLTLNGGQLVFANNSIRVSSSHSVFPSPTQPLAAYVSSLATAAGPAAAPSPRPRSISFFMLMEGSVWSISAEGVVSIPSGDAVIAFDDKYSVVLCSTEAIPNATYAAMVSGSRAVDIPANNRLMVGDAYLVWAHKASITVEGVGSAITFGNTTVTVFGVDETRAFAFVDSALILTASGTLQIQAATRLAVGGYGFAEFSNPFEDPNAKKQFFKPFFAIRNDLRYCPHLHINQTTNVTISPPLINAYGGDVPSVPNAAAPSAFNGLSRIGDALNGTTVAFMSLLLNSLLSLDDGASIAIHPSTTINLVGPYTVVFWQCGGDAVTWLSPMGSVSPSPRWIGDGYKGMLQERDISALGTFDYLGGGGPRTEFSEDYLLPSNVRTLVSSSPLYPLGGTAPISDSALRSIKANAFNAESFTRTFQLLRVGRNSRLTFDDLPINVTSYYGSATVLHVTGASVSRGAPSAVVAVAGGGVFGFINTVVTAKGRASAALVELSGYGTGMLVADGTSSIRIERNKLNILAAPTVLELSSVDAFWKRPSENYGSAVHVVLPELLRLWAFRIPPPALAQSPPAGGGAFIMRASCGAFAMAVTRGSVFSIGQNVANVSIVDTAFNTITPSWTSLLRDTFINSYVYSTPPPAFGPVPSVWPEAQVAAMAITSGAFMQSLDGGNISFSANNLTIANKRLGRRRETKSSSKDYMADLVASPRSLDASVLFIYGLAALRVTSHASFSMEWNKGTIAVASDALSPAGDTVDERRTHGLASVLSIASGGVLMVSSRRSSFAVANNILTMDAGAGNAALVASYNAQQWGASDLAIISITLNRITFVRAAGNTKGALNAFVVSGDAQRLVLMDYSTLCFSLNTIVGATGLGYLEAYLWRHDIKLQIRQNNFSNVLPAATSDLQAKIVVDTPPSSQLWQDSFTLLCNNTATEAGSAVVSDLNEYFSARTGATFGSVGKYLPRCREKPDCKLVGTSTLTLELTPTLSLVDTPSSTHSESITQTFSLPITASDTHIPTQTQSLSHTHVVTESVSLTHSDTLVPTPSTSETVTVSTSGSVSPTHTLSIMPTTWCERLYNRTRMVDWFYRSLEGRHTVLRGLPSTPWDLKEVEVEAALPFNVTDGDIRNGTALNNRTFPLPVPVSLFTVWNQVRATIMLERMVFQHGLFADEAGSERDPSITPSPSQMNPGGFGRFGTVIVNGTLHHSYNAVNLTLPPMPFYSIDVDEIVIIRISLRELSYCSDDAFYIGAMRIIKEERHRGEVRQAVGSAYTVVAMVANLFGGYQAAMAMQIAAISGLTRCSAVSSMEVFGQSFRLFNPFSLFEKLVRSNLVALNDRRNAGESMRHGDTYYDSLVGMLIGVLLMVGGVAILQIILFGIAFFRYVGFSMPRRLGVFWIPSLWLMVGIANYSGTMFAAIQLLTNSGDPAVTHDSHLGASYATIGAVAIIVILAFAAGCSLFPFLSLQFEFHPLVPSASGPFGVSEEKRTPMQIRLHNFFYPTGIIMAHHVRRRFYPLVAFYRESPHDSAARWRTIKRVLSCGLVSDTARLDAVMSDNKVAVGHLYSSVAWKAAFPFLFSLSVGLALIIYNSAAAPNYSYSRSALYTYDLGGVHHSAVLDAVAGTAFNAAMHDNVTYTEAVALFVESAMNDPCAQLHISIAAIHLAAAIMVVCCRLYVTRFQMFSNALSLLCGCLIFILACVLSVNPRLDAAKDGLACVAVILMVTSMASMISQWIAWYVDYRVTPTLKDFTDNNPKSSDLLSANLHDTMLLGGVKSIEEDGVKEWNGLVIDPLRTWYHRGTWDRRLYNNVADEQYNMALQQSIQRRSEFIVDFMNDNQPTMTEFEKQRVDMMMEMDELDLGDDGAFAMRMLSPREVVAHDERVRSFSRMVPAGSTSSVFMPPPPTAVRHGHGVLAVDTAVAKRPVLSSARQKRKAVGGGKQAAVPKPTPSRELDYSPRSAHELEDM